MPHNSLLRKALDSFEMWGKGAEMAAFDVRPTMVPAPESVLSRTSPFVCLRGTTYFF